MGPTTSLSQYFSSLLYQGMEYFGRYYSSYRAYVVENEDPDGMNRIKVVIPQITRNSTHARWAYAKNQISGDGYGIHALPQKGDLVFIEFEFGDVKFPMWTFGHYYKGKKPTEFDSPLKYGFKTPAGQIILIDDTEDVQKIIFNGGVNEGLVKVIELTEKLNNLEQKLNDFLDHYKNHIHLDPLSGQTGNMPQALAAVPPGAPDPTTPQPSKLTETQQSDIENSNIYH
jgi:hypothetical protein